MPAGSGLLFCEGLHGAVKSDKVNISQHSILRIGVVPDESMLVIGFANPRGIDFPYLLSMLPNSIMSRPDTIVCAGSKMSLAMQLIFTPMLWQSMDKKKRAA